MRLFSLSILFLSGIAPTCSQTFVSYKKLSRPEKCWVWLHPVAAKKAFRVTQKALAAVDSLKKDTVLDTDLNGGQLDAFKHAYWMAMLAKKIHPRKAYKLGLAHEKGNYRQWKRKELEDSLLPDSVSSVMDIANNQCGIEIGVRCYDFSPEKIKEVVILEIKKGNLKIILKDENKKYLDCDWKEIDMNHWIGKWDIPKCLVASNRIYNAATFPEK